LLRAIRLSILGIAALDTLDHARGIDRVRDEDEKWW